MGIRSMVFDFDGTLVRSEAIKRRVFYEVTARLGDVSEIVEAVLASPQAGDRWTILRAIVERALAGGAVPVTTTTERLAAELAEEYTRRCQAQIAICEEVPGAHDALRELSSGGRALFVNSGTPMVSLEKVLELRSLRSYFRAVYGRPGTKWENLTAILERTGADPTEVLCVGDQDEDRVVAREAGCHFVGIVSSASDFGGDGVRLIPDLRGLAALAESL